MSDKQGLIEKLALRYIESSASRNVFPADEPFILNEQEQALIKKITLQTLIAAGLLGTAGVLALYLPQYFFPALFPVSKIQLWGHTFQLEIVTTVYGILLIWPEIWGLNYFNLRAVRIISNACMFPRPDSPDFENHVNVLTQAGLEIEHKGMSLYKIDPYLGMPRYQYWFFILITRFKATLSNLLVKIILKRILGRFALRQVTDLAGIPVFAFWNMWASLQVIREARMRIMAPMAISGFISLLRTQTELNNDLVKKIPQLIQFAAQLKRKYNYAIYLLAEGLYKEFGIRHVGEKGEVKSLDWNEKNARIYSEILVCALVIDGELSLTEKRAVRSLQANPNFLFTEQEVQLIAEKYQNGKGLQFSFNSSLSN